MITALIDIVDRRNNDDRENIGLANIASFLQKEGYPVDLYSFQMNEPFSELDPSLPYHDLFGFSFYPNTALEVFLYAKRIKKLYPQALVCLGGKLASAVPSDILADCKEIDFIVLGYGEVPMLQVLQSLDHGTALEKVPSIFIPGKGAILGQNKNMPVLSPNFRPRRDFLPIAFQHGNFTARINGSYGCYGGCTFCSVNQYTCITKKNWFGREAEDLFNEMVNLHEIYGVNSFYFNDASFEDPPGRAGKNRIEKLCNLILGSNSRFSIRCSMRSESFMEGDGDLLELMKSSGFTQVFLGIEAGDDRDLKVYRKRARTADHDRALQLFRSKGIDIILGFIMLNPYSTIETMMENYNFLIKQSEYRLDPFIRKVDVYAGTSLEKKLRLDHLLTENFNYRRPLEYHFVHTETARYDEFLEEIRGDDALGAYDGKLYHLTCVMNNLRALYGEVADSYFSEFMYIRQQLATLLSSYFAIVYVENDLILAKERYEDFKRELLDMSFEVDSFILKLMHKRKFRDYFLKEIG
ncbi:B12-binding domain-containing radical SAM protein [Paenibacillus massiliensis]|uniref:B12-binding domain-containing radical SAM protein n=2 Tax=Paenibacillus massiliensis TaxID=225917 RepID=UPI00046F58E0|nr:radical SAM protein [Paenibacillus massiliensis]